MKKISNIKYLVLSIILLSIFSCEKNGWEEVFENNQLIERSYYESDKILIIEKYDKGQIEFITRYYPSGNVKELGPVNTDKNKDRCIAIINKLQISTTALKLFTYLFICCINSKMQHR